MAIILSLVFLFTSVSDHWAASQGVNNIAHDHLYAVSVDSMTGLIPIQHKLYGNLSAYANKLEAKLQTIRRALTQIQPLLEQAEAQPELYLGNPLQAYGLIRHMHHDWPHWLDYLAQPVGAEEIAAIMLQYNKLPDPDDIADANSGMFLIQHMYNLNTQDLVHGQLHNNATLSTPDCWTLGKFHYDLGHFDLASDWLQLAVAHYNEAHRSIYDIQGFSRLALYQLYSKSLAQQNRFEEALAVIESGINHMPQESRLQSLRLKLQTRSQMRIAGFRERPVPPEGDVERVCRGNYKWISRLHCSYNDSGSAFHRLAPFKMEQVLLDPYMVIYYDVISADEIKLLQHYAKLNFSSPEMNLVEGDKQHTAKLSWLPKEIPLVIQLNKRLAAMTGLDMDKDMDDQRLLTSNYGLGGFRAAHLDYSTEKVLQVDNRYASVIIYMSNVAQGGATAFPHLEMAIKPQVGTALVWYNLLDSLQVDPRTWHLSCPVLEGSKWITSKWISAKAQTFKRRCFEQRTGDWRQELKKRDKVNQRKLLNDAVSKFY